MGETWKSVLANPADIKELIPEFYSSNGRFLENSLGLDLGNKQNGERVEDVKLPPWASDPEDFIKKNRAALESEHVSAHLHHWIDLVFGYKQRGEEAVLANNLFYYLTYEGAVDLEQIEDPTEKRAVQVQIYEFGQTPKQLFTKAHPTRNSPLSKDFQSSHQSSIRSNVQQRVPTDPAPSRVDRPTSDNGAVAQNHEVLSRESSNEPIRAWCSNSVSVSKTSEVVKAHRQTINAICLSSGQDSAFTVSSDKFLTIVDVAQNKVKRRAQVSRLALSTCELIEESNTLVMGSWDNAVYFYSIEYARLKSRTVCHDDAVAATSIARKNSSLLATASWDSTVKIWDVSRMSQASKPVSSFFDHDCPVKAVQLNSDGTLVLSCSTAGTVVIRDMRCYEPVQVYECNAASTSSLSVAWLKNDNAVLHARTDGTLQVFDMHR